MNRKSKSFGRRSSILKLDANWDNDTGILGRNRRQSRRVSFAETYQVKEFPRDSPRVFKDTDHDEQDVPGQTDNASQNKSEGITGLDKLLTGAIQTPYQTNTDIPDMASASFNLFDKTILDPVDMETTYAGGEIGTFFPPMDFQNEPSVELKFDAPSWLQSLKSNYKASDSLKTMQIYSPNRERNVPDNERQSPLSDDRLPFNISISDHDKENIMVPMETFQGVGNKSGPESKSLIERFLSGGSALHNTSPTMDEDMDITTHAEKENMNNTVNMEETVTVGGILNRRKSGGLKMQSDYTDGNEYNDRTRCYNLGEDNYTMEETKCIGGILNNDRALDVSSSEEIKINRKLGDGIVSGLPMSVINSSNSSIAESKQSNKTINFKDTDMGEDIEETKVVGGIVYKVGNDTVADNDCDVGMDITLDVTQSVLMEETKALGNIIVTEPPIKAVSESNIDGEFDKTIKLSEAMEETKPIGGILKYDNVTVTNCLFTSIGMSANGMDATIKLSEAMEETRPVGGILDQSVNDNTGLGRTPVLNKFNATINQTVPIEETKPVGGILDQSVNNNQDTRINPVLSNFNATMNQTMPIEETKPVGGILDQSVFDNKDTRTPVLGNLNATINQTMAIEETRPVGGILDQSVKDNTGVGRTPVLNKLNETVNQTMPVEETRTVGGILNKTEDKTLYFEDVNTDWTSHDLKNNQLGMASDGTLVSKQHMTFAMEETKCITNVIEVGPKGNSVPVTENYGEILPVTNKTVLDVTDMQITRTIPETRVDTGISQHEQFEDMKVDDEITFKGLKNKGNFDERKDIDDKTKEFTQTTQNLMKLKEKLILSRRKSMTKTPSKISPFCPNSLTLSASKGACKLATTERDETRSPVHKRQKLFSSPDVELTESTTGLLREVGDAAGDGSVVQTTPNAQFYGIDDEPMPDTMHISSLVPASSNKDKHSLDDKTSTSLHDVDRTSTSLHDVDRTSTSLHDDDRTSSSLHDDDASRSTTSLHDVSRSTTSLHDVDVSRSSNNDTRSSTSGNMSMMSNKSFAKSSFVMQNAPEGPMTLNTFYERTFSLKSKVIGSRCSAVFFPKIDLDDLGEVLEAELTLGAKVKAQKKCKDKFVELTSRSQENIEWLEKMLEETQPKIFQDCANASSDELNEITGELRSLSKACHKQVHTVWKNSTKEMYDEILQDVQENGIKKAEEILSEKVRSDKFMDDLLASLDEDLKELEVTEQTLNTLEEKQGNLKMELVKLTDCVQSETDVKKQLECTLCQNVEQDTYSKEKTSLTEQIQSHLMCTEWYLEEWNDNKAVFSFLEEKVELSVQFEPGVEEKSISNILLNTVHLKESHCLEDKIAVDFVSRWRTLNDLKKKYKTFSSLKMLLHEVSCTMSEIRRFCMELEKIRVYKVLNYVNDSIVFDLWSRETLDMISLELTFDPSHPLTKPLCCMATVQIGSLSNSDIEKHLQTVEPGQDYLGRLIRSVDFKQLHST